MSTILDRPIADTPSCIADCVFAEFIGLNTLPALILAGANGVTNSVLDSECSHSLYQNHQLLGLDAIHLSNIEQ